VESAFGLPTRLNLLSSAATGSCSNIWFSSEGGGSGRRGEESRGEGMRGGMERGICGRRNGGEKSCVSSRSGRYVQLKRRKKNTATSPTSLSRCRGVGRAILTGDQRAQQPEHKQKKGFSRVSKSLISLNLLFLISDEGCCATQQMLRKMKNVTQLVARPKAGPLGGHWVGELFFYSRAMHVSTMRAT
jgi:hypothetical protein